MESLYTAGSMPDFLCIGAPKAGTSWLYRNIKRHPAVWMPPLKEIHYFDGLLPSLPLIVSIFDPNLYVSRKATFQRLFGHRRRRHRRHLRWYLRFLLLPRTDRWYMSLFAPGQGQTSGDITPSYSFMSANRVARVRVVLPKAKIIYLLRNPVTQMWSQTAMHFWIWYRQRLPEVTEKRLEKYIERKKRTKLLRYSANLQTWARFYPEEQIYVGFFDQLIEAPVTLFKEICHFLELDASDPTITKNVTQKRNVGTYPDIPDHLAHHLAQHYQPEIEALHQRFDNKHTAAWLDFASRYL